MHEVHPMGPVVMRQRWESLLFLHWRMDAEGIQATLPPGLTVDCFDGEAYVAVVPFLMRRVRPRFLFSVPGLSNFHELNLRTYVRDEAGRPGVWFYSLDADQPLAVMLARTLFSLPYQHARMHYRKDADGWERFTSQRAAKREQVFHYKPASATRHAEPGSFEAYCVERYRLFSYNYRKQQLYTGELRHAPYQLSEVEIASYSTDLFALNGFAEPSTAPDHVVWAAPVDVSIYPLEKAS